MFFRIENYIGFLVAGILLNLTPGVDTMYILTRSIAQGKKAGIYSVLGIGTGCLIHTVFASFGLSIILMKSAAVFIAVRYLGVAYLLYLGIKMILDKNSIIESDSIKIKETDLFSIYRQGVLTNVLNPKVALFFLSFLPQFINAKSAAGPIPFLILGLTFMTTGTTWCLFVAYAASSVSTRLRNNERIGKMLQKLSGFVFIGMGLKLLAEKK